MAKKVDIEVNISDILVHLRDNGEFRKALIAIAAQKAGGEEIGTIKLIQDVAELSDSELDAVAGGAMRASRSLGSLGVPATVDYGRITGPGIDPGKLPGFADTSW